MAEECYKALNAAQTDSETDSLTTYRCAQFARHLGSAPRFWTSAVIRGEEERCCAGQDPWPQSRDWTAAGGARRRIRAGVYDAVYIGDLPLIARAGNRFDALVMGELIEHVPYAALEDFISSAARVLSPRGRGCS
jgi:hypothetical protein